MDLKYRALAAVVYLGSKRILLQIIFTFSNIILARLLFPEDFGAFAVVGFATTFFLVFCDLGFAPAIVQKKGRVYLEELKTAFTFQLFLIVIVFAVIYVVSPGVSDFFNLGEQGVRLFRIYSLYLFFLPFKTTSGAILERNLDYRKLVIVEVLDVFVASVVSISGALAGLGVFSFVAGGLAGHFFGATFYFLMAPWRLGLSFSKKALLRLAKFGLPYQSNLALGLFWGPLVLLYLGKVVGNENLGFFQFAASLAVLPLAVSEIVNRLIFPLGSRLQADKDTFRKIIERSLVVVSITTLPLLAIALASAREIIHFVYTDKWLPSLPALYFGLMQTSIIAYTGVFSQLLLARGRAKYLRNMALVWAILTWTVAPPLISKFNFVGMNLTGILVSLSGIWLFIKLRKEIEFSISKNILPYFVSATIAGLLVFGLLRVLPYLFVSLFAAVVLGFLTFFAFVMFFARRAFIENFRFILDLVVRRK